MSQQVSSKHLYSGAQLALRFVTLSLIGWFGTAQAVEVTDMPNGLRGDVTLSYVGQFGRHNLVQNDQQVGQRRLNTHDFDVRFEFAPVNGISFYATLPNTV